MPNPKTVKRKPSPRELQRDKREMQYLFKAGIQLFEDGQSASSLKFMKAIVEIAEGKKSNITVADVERAFRYKVEEKEQAPVFRLSVRRT